MGRHGRHAQRRRPLDRDDAVAHRRQIRCVIPCARANIEHPAGSRRHQVEDRPMDLGKGDPARQHRRGRLGISLRAADSYRHGYAA